MMKRFNKKENLLHGHCKRFSFLLIYMMNGRIERKMHEAAEMNKTIEVSKFLLNLIPYAQKKIAAASLEQL